MYLVNHTGSHIVGITPPYLNSDLTFIVNPTGSHIKGHCWHYNITTPHLNSEVSPIKPKMSKKRISNGHGSKNEGTTKGGNESPQIAKGGDESRQIAKGGNDSPKTTKGGKVSPRKDSKKEITKEDFTPRPAQWRDPLVGEAVDIRNNLAHTKVTLKLSTLKLEIFLR